MKNVELLDEIEVAPETPKDRFEVPPTVSAFLSSLDNGEHSVKVTLRRIKNGKKEIIRTFEADELDECEFSVVGIHYGPGKYNWTFHWWDFEKKDTINRSFTHTLAKDEYIEPHLEYKRDQQNRIDRNHSGVQSSEPVDVGKAVKESMNMAMQFAEKLNPVVPPIATSEGGIKDILIMMEQNRKEEAEKRREAKADLFKFATLILPFAMEFMKRPKQENDPMGMFEKAMSTVMAIADVKQAMAPPEKESTVDKMIDLVSKNLPTVTEMISMNMAERQKNLMYNMVQANSEVKSVDADPEKRKEVVQGIAKKSGLKAAQNICELMGWHEFDAEINRAMQNAKGEKTPSEPTENQEEGDSE